MRLRLSIAPTLILAVSCVALAQDAASDTGRAVKATSHASVKVATTTAHDTTKGVVKTAKAADHATKVTGRGVKKGAKVLGRGAKKSAAKTADALK